MKLVQNRVELTLKYDFTLYSPQSVEGLILDAGLKHISTKHHIETPFEFNGEMIERESVIVEGSK